MQHNRLLFLVACIGKPKPKKKATPVKKKLVAKSKEKVLLPLLYASLMHSAILNILTNEEH